MMYSYRHPFNIFKKKSLLIYFIIFSVRNSTSFVSIFKNHITFNDIAVLITILEKNKVNIG